MRLFLETGDLVTIEAQRAEAAGWLSGGERGELAVCAVKVDQCCDIDITDAVMRALVDDPYAYEKMKIMDETREVRAGMAMADRSARLREAQSKLRGYLEKIWRIGKWTVAQKRRVYFALWDEVAEKGDAELLRAGEEARATIDAFVRARLPPGGPDAYLAEELEELNRIRKSGRRFDPYRAR